MVVVAGIGHQGLGKRRALAGNAAIYSRDILGFRPRDVAERAAGLDRFVLPAHSAEPQLGAPLVVWRIQRIQKGRTDGAASEQGFKLESRATRIRGRGTKAARHRERYRGGLGVAAPELQQIGGARGTARA